MTFPTRPAFVHYGTWDDETRAHPAMKEQYTLACDSKATDDLKNNFMSPDHVLVRTTGQKHAGAQQSIDAMYKEIYAPFAKWMHIPTHIICYEVDDGWEMMCFATLYWTLAAPGEQESGQKVKDEQGKEWDGADPAAYKFRYRKNGEGIRMAKTETAADRTGAMVGMLKRGVMKPEDLLNLS